VSSSCVAHYLEEGGREGGRSGAIPALWCPGGAFLDSGPARDQSARDPDGKGVESLCAQLRDCSLRRVVTAPLVRAFLGEFHGFVCWEGGNRGESGKSELGRLLWGERCVGPEGGVSGASAGESWGGGNAGELRAGENCGGAAAGTGRGRIGVNWAGMRSR
jgi:hypothetical protein